MTADEHWRYRLRCPGCGLTGVMEERELDGWPYRNAVSRGKQFHWVTCSHGFEKVDETPEGYAKVICAACKLPPIREPVR